jgi:cell division septation protein DedD
MKIGNYTIAASALALGLATFITPCNVQGQPLYDRVNVCLPYSVTIGRTVLQPGNYVIRQQRSFSGDTNVLLIYGDDGRKFETAAVTIPAFENETQESTRVTLHHFGKDYYFDRVWIEGKDYGYEFPLPDNVKAREKEMMQPICLAARFTATTQQQPVAAEAPAPQPPPEAAPEPTPEVPPAPPEEPQTANREAPPMPHTSAGWLMMLLGGGTLSGMGMALRRKV